MFPNKKNNQTNPYTQLKSTQGYYLPPGRAANAFAAKAGKLLMKT
jgi:hypothetical protein